MPYLSTLHDPIDQPCNHSALFEVQGCILLTFVKNAYGLRPQVLNQAFHEQFTIKQQRGERVIAVFATRKASDNGIVYTDTWVGNLGENGIDVAESWFCFDDVGVDLFEFSGGFAGIKSAND
ncbi:hypothetical protein HYC85_016757 [Camellia sinensis]|uniref:Uncharacterized protein n=1 Tax=Camellia sinensis TaxID=4442 RepID=A0A7J7H0K1_CAMSI|nr:hypothetical protein HYC85_016757 [Camellia sinensis]